MASSSMDCGTPTATSTWGQLCEKCASDHGISRDDQDAYAELSYERSRAAKKLPCPRDCAGRSEAKEEDHTITEDEEPAKDTSPDCVRYDRPSSRTARSTAANASKLNDGAASLVVCDVPESAKKETWSRCVRSKAFGDAQRTPMDFTMAPSLAVPAALAHAELDMSDVSLHEVNEAFAVVALANAQILDVDVGKVNQRGGAVSLGHPIGMSGARASLGVWRCNLTTSASRRSATAGRGLWPRSNCCKPPRGTGTAMKSPPKRLLAARNFCGPAPVISRGRSRRCRDDMCVNMSAFALAFAASAPRRPLCYAHGVLLRIHCSSSSVASCTTISAFSASGTNAEASQVSPTITTFRGRTFSCVTSSALTTVPSCNTTS